MTNKPSCASCEHVRHPDKWGLRCKNPLRYFEHTKDETSDRGLCGESFNNYAPRRLPTRADLVRAEAEARRKAQEGQS